MKRDYIAEKADRKKATNQAMWVLMFFIILFIAMIARVATRSGSLDSFFSSTPSGDDAYKIAQDYIKPTLGSREVKFAEDGYQYTKRSDSVYVVKSYFETTYGVNRAVKTNFIITLRYIGGTRSEEQNWSVVNLDEFQ